MPEVCDAPAREALVGSSTSACPAPGLMEARTRCVAKTKEAGPVGGDSRGDRTSIVARDTLKGIVARDARSVASGSRGMSP